MFTLAIAVVMAAKADLVLVNGNVVTLDPKVPRAEAIAIAKGKVIAVGTTAEIGKLSSNRVDLAGATVVPGLVDAHAHVASLGFDLQEVALGDAKDFDEVVARVAEAAKKAKPGTWIYGNGWDQNDWPEKRFPEHAKLSAATPDHFVALSRVDGHAMIVNAKALAAAKIGKETKDPDGGRIVRGADGEPTGLLVDSAMSIVSFPERTVEETKTAILRAQEEILKQGLTGVHDMGIGRTNLQAYRELVKEGKLVLRIHGLLRGSDEKLVSEMLAKKPVKEGTFELRGVKYFADGALGSRGAALLADYSDEPGNRGLVLMEEKELEAKTIAAMKAGWQVAVHAIGDRGNRVVLDVFERSLAKTKKKAADVRPRVEHAQVVALEDLPRFAKLGVIASVQPTHATSDMPWAEQRVGPERIRGAYAWRTLADSGARIAAGSDFPVERVSPLEGLYAAMTRQARDGSPAGGWTPAQRMTPEEALRAFTQGAAWAGFSETRRGTIAPGFDADFTVLDRDPLATPPSELLKTRVLRTIVNGKIVHTSDSSGG